MNPVDRRIRAAAYRHVINTSEGATIGDLAAACAISAEQVRESLSRLEEEHLLATTADGDAIRMIHPFSGVPTGYRSIVGNSEWHANCAWDALAILAIVGDGRAVAAAESGPIEWEVSGGEVRPDGVIHLRVPASQFWDDIVFT